jgi:hypothetical protein
MTTNADILKLSLRKRSARRHEGEKLLDKDSTRKTFPPVQDRAGRYRDFS